MSKESGQPLVEVSRNAVGPSGSVYVAVCRVVQCRMLLRNLVLQCLLVCLYQMMSESYE